MPDITRAPWAAHTTPDRNGAPKPEDPRLDFIARVLAVTRHGVSLSSHDVEDAQQNAWLRAERELATSKGPRFGVIRFAPLKLDHERLTWYARETFRCELLELLRTPWRKREAATMDAPVGEDGATWAETHPEARGVGGRLEALDPAKKVAGAADARVVLEWAAQLDPVDCVLVDGRWMRDTQLHFDTIAVRVRAETGRAFSAGALRQRFGRLQDDAPVEVTELLGRRTRKDRGQPRSGRRTTLAVR